MRLPGIQNRKSKIKNSSSVLAALLLILLILLVAVVALERGRNSECVAIRFRTRPFYVRRSPAFGFDHSGRWARRGLFWFFRLFWSVSVLRGAFGFIAQVVCSLRGFAGLRFADRALGLASSRNHFFVYRHVLRELIVWLVLQELLHEVHPHRQRRDRAGFLIPERLFQTWITDPHARCVGRRIADEPGVGEIVNGSGLSTDHPLGEFLVRHHRAGRSASHDSAHHVLHLRCDIR